jgi:hypothetical protein
MRSVPQCTRLFEGSSKVLDDFQFVTELKIPLMRLLHPAEFLTRNVSAHIGSSAPLLLLPLPAKLQGLHTPRPRQNKL